MKVTTQDDGTIDCTLSKDDRKAIRTCHSVLEQLAFHARRSPSDNQFALLADLVGALVPTEVCTFTPAAEKSPEPPTE
jgi:hypothetical protein